MFKYSKYLLLAAGTGCAPMVSVARRVVEDDNDITVLKLLYANRTYEDIIFKAELKELARNWNFTYRHHLSQVTAYHVIDVCLYIPVNLSEYQTCQPVRLKTLGVQLL